MMLLAQLRKLFVPLLSDSDLRGGFSSVSVRVLEAIVDDLSLQLAFFVPLHPRHPHNMFRTVTRSRNR
uniref:Uncharacterized protein n=1 Tax=Candidatus Kentrum sp. TUN TaxID=2126343 RepID=A0A450ZSY9_9GAMM|nr:MAG: hypothetical protein BECKTUN1418F_GA0071002_10988 [Candidatus Kentron sp. TUN]VFK64310.1 MAG: hypothetical protein BECKTUN1418E_GA0071001_10959 [Candidatus Kentron sp. TUN]VFK65858.1 MAG: hypothetical protein BECKTUN1418D_GA0071000_13851 [Candidatus Kentron sp. TUN]